jgi:tRNA modification GTPase
VTQAVTIDGVKLEFSDTAGLHPTADAVEIIGVSLAHKAADKSAVVLAVFDNTRPLEYDDEIVLSTVPAHVTWCVLNKCDGETRIDTSVLMKKYGKIYRVSAKTGEGVSELLHDIAARFHNTTVPGESVISNPRQAAAIDRAGASIRRAIWSARLLTADVCCTDVEDAIAALGEITGQTASQEIIDAIFSRFCVGK